MRRQARHGINPVSSAASLCCLIVFAVALAHPPRLFAQAEVIVDHGKRTVLVPSGAKYDTLREGERFRVETGKLVVKIVNTNTALYKYGLKQEAFVAEEVSALRGFLGDLKPYFVEIGQVFDQNALRTRELEDSLTTGNAVPWLLYSLDCHVKHMRSVNVRLLAALEGMSRRAAGSGAPADLAATVTYLNEDMERVPGPDSARCGLELSAVLNALSQLEDPFADRLNELRKKGDTLAATMGEKTMLRLQAAIADAPKLLASSQELRSLWSRLKSASSEYVIPESVRISAEKGRKLTISVVPTANKILAAYATADPLEIVVEAAPDWLARPSLGLSFLASPGSMFPRYGTKQVEDGFEIIDKRKDQDHRFTWGLTLGITWRGLDWRKNSGFAIWLPEFTVNPADGVRAMGLGGAISYRFLKFGLGALWTKHEELNGQVEELVLDAAEDLKLHDTYGSPKLYVSISLFGWPPFVAD